MNGPQPPLSDLQLAQGLRGAGFQGEGLVTMFAVVLGESGADPDNVGDEALVTSKWGPSIGLAQIRSLWADRGTGRPRDPDRLTDPAFNLRAAHAISSGGTNFQPWSVFTSGAYRSHLDRAWRAISGLGGATASSGLEGAAGLQTLAGADLPGAGFVAGVVEPVRAGLAKIALVALFLAGGVALVLAGGWRAVGAPVADRVQQRAGDAATAATGGDPTALEPAS